MLSEGSQEKFTTICLYNIILVRISFFYFIKFDEYPDAGQFNYSGVCGITCGDEGAGEIAIGGSSCVASQSGWGDGSYPVYATRTEDGRIASLTIQFISDDEDEDDDE